MAQAKASLDIDRANREAFDRLCNSNPILVDVRPAIEVVPGMTKESVLTSGPPMAWGDYVGGQRAALIGGALYEGLARSAEEADEKFASGAIKVGRLPGLRLRRVGRWNLHCLDAGLRRRESNVWEHRLL